MSTVGADLRPLAEVGWMRVASSAHPDRFRVEMARTLVALYRGDDPATTAYGVADPTQLAAEIEALAGVRRLDASRKETP